MTTTQPSLIASLMLNSWSAEYALRCVPLPQTYQSAEDKINWVFPQAHYAALFSAQAVLCCQGNFTANPDAISKAMNALAEDGFYSKDHAFTQYNNPYADLAIFRITTTAVWTPPATVYLPDFHRGLIDKVQAISLIHEGYLLYRLGTDAFADIIAGLPAHLQSGFITDRFAQLTTLK